MRSFRKTHQIKKGFGTTDVLKGVSFSLDRGQVLAIIGSSGSGKTTLLKNGGNTMIVVTHEMEFAKSVADVVIYMADGVIEEMGTPEAVFDHPRSEKTRNFLRGAQEKF